MAINGSAESRTSHASMPPGLTTRSMVIACAAEAASHKPDAGDKRGQRACALVAEKSRGVHERFSSGRASLTR
jgi:hypothetical protein